MKIKKCSQDNIPLLAEMNKMLIEDEGSDNTMNTTQLEDRMTGFLEGEYHAYFFTKDEDVVGYALVRHTVSPVYLRQFFICREFRRKHYGKEALQKLMAHLNTTSIDIDVLTDNTAGYSFWKSLGFEERYVGMRLKK